MHERTPEDRLREGYPDLQYKIRSRLREEYFELLPEIRRVAWHIETEIRSRTLSAQHILNPYEQLIVKTRIKDCESAWKALERRQEGRVFDLDRPGDYSITQLPDLAGARVLVFPRERFIEVDRILQDSTLFAKWATDPIPYAGSSLQAPKYYGLCPDVSGRVQGEYQVVPMLIGNFWDVEHSAMYKPAGWAKGIENDPDMKRLRAEVESSLAHFEAGFERFVQKNSQPISSSS